MGDTSAGNDETDHPGSLAEMAAEFLSLPRRHALEDVVTEAGIDPQLFEACSRALGLSRDGRLTDEEARDAERLARLQTVLDAEDLTQLTRRSAPHVAGLALGTLEYALRRAFPRLLKEGLLAGDDGAEVLSTLFRALLMDASELIASAYRREVRHLLASELIQDEHDIDRIEETYTRHLAVGFVDIVNYSGITRGLSPRDLLELINRFESAIASAANDSSTVQLVKFLGDGAMLVAPTIEDVIEVLVILVARTITSGSGSSVGRLSAGASYGEVLSLGDDFFGSRVNVAARLANAAEAETVLIDDEVSPPFVSDGEVTRVQLAGIGMHPARRIEPNGWNTERTSES